MSLQTQLASLISAIGADIKALQADSDAIGNWANPSTYKTLNIDRRSQTTAGLTITSGRLFLVGIPLVKGHVITNLSFMSGTTAAATLTNHWFALYDVSTLALIRQTVNAGSAAWAANTVKTLALSSTYTVPATGMYYAGIMVAATTTPSLIGTSSVGNFVGLAPTLSGNSTTGLTTTAPATAAALSASAGIPLAMSS